MPTTPAADRPCFAAFLDLRGQPGIVVWLRKSDPLQALAMRGAALEVVPMIVAEARVKT